MVKKKSFMTQIINFFHLVLKWEISNMFRTLSMVISFNDNTLSKSDERKTLTNIKETTLKIYITMTLTKF